MIEEKGKKKNGRENIKILPLKTWKSLIVFMSKRWVLSWIQLEPKLNYKVINFCQGCKGLIVLIEFQLIKIKLMYI